MTEEVTILIEEQIEEVTILVEEVAGPPGKDATNDSLSETITSGENLSGHRAIYKLSSEAFYADKNIPSTLKTILGITSGSAMSGAGVIVVTQGEMTESSWTWSFPGLVFLGNDGILTQDLPETGSRVIIGSANSATTLYVKIREPIMLI
jgi:hypothetical protein